MGRNLGTPRGGETTVRQSSLRPPEPHAAGAKAKARPGRPARAPGRQEQTGDHHLTPLQFKSGFTLLEVDLTVVHAIWHDTFSSSYSSVRRSSRVGMDAWAPGRVTE